MNYLLKIPHDMDFLNKFYNGFGGVFNWIRGAVGGSVTYGIVDALLKDPGIQQAMAEAPSLGTLLLRAAGPELTGIGMLVALAIRGRRPGE